MYVIVGLGNPGKKFDRTRHNVGFDTIDYLSKKHGIDVNKLKFKALIGQGRIGGEKVILVKPQTFMNLSGESVIQILNYYDVPIENLIVVYDDIDTDFGKLRIRKKGSGGSHNGMRNIIYLTQQDNFPRVRIGIGKPVHGDLANFVLAKFTKEDIDIIAKSIEKAGQSIETIISDNIENAMNKYNG